jgi:hypothetical protein
MSTSKRRSAIEMLPFTLVVTAGDGAGTMVRLRERDARRALECGLPEAVQGALLHLSEDPDAFEEALVARLDGIRTAEVYEGYHFVVPECLSPIHVEEYEPPVPGPSV